MAFKKLEMGFSKALSLGKKRGEVKSATGFLVGLKTREKEYKVKGKKLPEVKLMHIYKMVDSKGLTFEVWGNGALNFSLLTDDKKPKIKKEYLNKLVRFTFAGMLPKKPGQNAGRKIDIEIDDKAKLPKGVGRIQF